MILRGLPGVADASNGSEARIEVSRTSSKRMGSVRGRSREARSVVSSDSAGSPKGVGDGSKDT
jgi:hypothetical protein